MHGMSTSHDAQADHDDYQTPDELARIYRCHGETIRRWARDGCPHRRWGRRRILLRRADIDQWLQDQHEQQSSVSAPGGES